MLSRLLGLFVVACVLGLSSSALRADPVGTAFSYQGELRLSGNPVTTAVNATFRLYAAETGGSPIGPALNFPTLTPSGDGRFAVSLDFGAGALTDEARWLEITIDATTLSRVRLTVAPYAHRAQVASTAASALLAATSSDSAALGGQAPAFYQNAANMSAGTLADARLSGNIPRLVSSNTFVGALNAFTGNVSVGTTLSGERLSVAGVVHSTSGGFKFPDGSIQLAASPAITVYVVGPLATDPYNTIQAAVAAAQVSGQPAAIVVKPGTYSGNVTITAPGTHVMCSAGSARGAALLNGCVTISLSAPGRSSWTGVDIRCASGDAFVCGGTNYTDCALSDCTVTSITGHAINMACTGVTGTSTSLLSCSGIDGRSLGSLQAVLYMAVNARVVYANGILAKQDPIPDPDPKPDNGKGAEVKGGKAKFKHTDCKAPIDATDNAQVELERVDVQTESAAGLRLKNQAKATCEQCSFECGTAVCATVEDAAEARMFSCTLESTAEECCSVMATATLEYANACFAGGARRMPNGAVPMGEGDLLAITRYVVGTGSSNLWTLQDAINSACAVSLLSGETQTIYVMPGTYTGNINIPGGKVTIVAAAAGTVKINGALTAATGAGGNINLIDIDVSSVTASQVTLNTDGVFSAHRCTFKSAAGAAAEFINTSNGRATLFGCTFTPSGSGSAVLVQGGGVIEASVGLYDSVLGPSPYSPLFPGKSLQLQNSRVDPCQNVTFNAPAELVASAVVVRDSVFRSGSSAAVTLDASSTATLVDSTVDTTASPCMTAPTAGSLRVADLTFVAAGSARPAGTVRLETTLPAAVVRFDAPGTFTAAEVFSVAPSFTAAGAPFAVSSTALVSNLNADRLDGMDSSAFLTFSTSLGGDCSGTVAAVSVDRIRGRMVSVAVPADGQVLKFNAGTSSWTPSADLGNVYVAGAGLSLTGNTFSVATLGVDAGMLADNSVNGAKVADSSIGSADLAFDAASLLRVSGGRMTADPISVYVGSAPVLPTDFAVTTVGPARNAARFLHSDPLTLKPTVSIEGSGRNTWCLEVRATDAAGNQAAGKFTTISVGTGSGVIGEITNPTNTGAAVLGTSANLATGYGVFAQGRLGSTGPKPFHIDHPLDPANKFLDHYAAESPQPLNLYRGAVVLDGDGQAVVVLPDYFDAINRDVHYQLTCVGGFAPVYIAEEVRGNTFRIGGGTPDLKVCWTVTAARNDAYMRTYGAPIESDKPPSVRGKYLHPEFYGKPQSDAIYPQSPVSAQGPSVTVRP